MRGKLISASAPRGIDTASLRPPQYPGHRVLAGPGRCARSSRGPSSRQLWSQFDAPDTQFERAQPRPSVEGNVERCECTMTVFLAGIVPASSIFLGLVVSPTAGEQETAGE